MRTSLKLIRIDVIEKNKILPLAELLKKVLKTSVSFICWFHWSQLVSFLKIKRAIEIVMKTLVFEKSKQSFELKDDRLQMITAYAFRKKSSSDGLNFFWFTKEIMFDSDSFVGRKNTSDWIVARGCTKNQKKFSWLRKKSVYINLGLGNIERKVGSLQKALLLSENPKQFCERQRLRRQDKKVGNHTKKIGGEITAIFVIILEYN